MNIFAQLAIAFVIVIGSLVLFAKAARSAACLLDRFAKWLRVWADNQEEKRR